MNKQLLERFIKYVKIDTESVPDVEQYPSSEKQKDLLKLLLKELQELGIQARMDGKYGYVYAEIPANTKSKYALGFIAHVDTSSAVSGKDVKPIVTEHYDGGDIALAEGRVLSPKDYHELGEKTGKTIITSDGTTLLGADDKAGVAAIMQLAETIVTHPEIKHGTIKSPLLPTRKWAEAQISSTSRGLAQTVRTLLTAVAQESWNTRTSTQLLLKLRLTAFLCIPGWLRV